jgi:predicted DNA-binding transcriptional regulator AlpA
MNRHNRRHAAALLRRGVDRDDAAIYVGVTLSTFDEMVSDGRMPKPIQIGDERVWDLDQLDKSFNRLAGIERNPWD